MAISPGPAEDIASAIILQHRRTWALHLLEPEHMKRLRAYKKCAPRTRGMIGDPR